MISDAKIDKIIAVRTTVSDSADNKEKKENDAEEDADQEFLIKYKNKSYLRAEWVSR